LAQVTVRNPVGLALDLGTGCGIQALHAARHARRVIATDISERALAFARFNAALNLGPEHGISFRLGSLFEPVAGERFDLIVSNPPFVITPRSGESGAAADRAVGVLEYRDGGLVGDALIASLIADVGEHLQPGGIAQLLGNWEHRYGEGWRARVEGWLDASGTTGWVIQREVLDPAEYAQIWIRDGGISPDAQPERFAAALGAWLDDFEARSVEAVGFGIVTLRRPLAADAAAPAGRGVRRHRLEEHTGSIQQPLGPHIEASLTATQWLDNLTDEGLAAQHLVAAADVTEERYYTPGAADPNVIVIRQGGGLGRGVHASSPLAALVGVCDGELSLGQIVAALAGLYEVDAAALTSELIPATRRLIQDGFLTPHEI
jgi:methylase of polypeptide subunit release factors